MKHITSLKAWLHGLGSAVIGGAATGGGSWMATAVANAAGIKDVPVLNWKTVGVICAIGGLSNAFMYLKQSPLPKLEEDAVDLTPGNPS